MVSRVSPKVVSGLNPAARRYATVSLPGKEERKRENMHCINVKFRLHATLHIALVIRQAHDVPSKRGCWCRLRYRASLEELRGREAEVREAAAKAAEAERLERMPKNRARVGFREERAREKRVRIGLHNMFEIYYMQFLLRIL